MKKKLGRKKHDAFIKHALLVLKHAGIQITQPHLAILGYLAAAEHPLTAEEIQAHLHLDDVASTESIGKVLRILNGLAELAIVQNDLAENGFVVAAHDVPRVAMQIQTYCTQCRRQQLVELDGRVLESMIGHVKRTAQFTLSEQVVQIEGICPACLKR